MPAPNNRELDEGLDRALSRCFVLAAEARGAGNHPFSALLLVDGEIVAEALNLVTTTHDITAHAETMLVRLLESVGKLPLLSTGTVVASCEPCPMCVGAMFWAGARHVVFGLSAATLNGISAAPGDGRFGFEISAGEIGRRATPPMTIEGPYREDEAVVAHLGFW
jgi:tRNA(Arg) A34 adenosine deaminase TadA